jgi:hypothetical protein
VAKGNKLNELLDKGEIKRGKGFTLSTEEQQQGAQMHESTSTVMQKNTSAEEHKNTKALVQDSTGAQKHKGTNAEVQKSTNAEVRNSTSTQVHESISAKVHQNAETIRPSKGFKLREDIADACKLLAVQKKRKLYEVMEEALIEYLQKHGVDIH